jgi:glycosyl transferase family 25
MSFPPIYVINLPRDAERRAAIRARLDLMALQYRIVDAVDGKSLAPDAYDQRLRRRYFGRALTPGEIGCLLSHRRVCALMLAEQCPEAIVLEDDAVLSPDFVEVIKALQRCAHQWDLVRFVGSPKIHARGFRRVRPLCDSYWLIRLPTTPGGSHAYLLNRKAAAVLESQLGQSFLPMDILQGWSWRTGLETLAVYPTLAAQDADSGTTIGEERFSKAVALSGWERWLFPVNRFLYKTLDGWGKKRIWLGSWYRDRVIRRETARDPLP